MAYKSVQAILPNGSTFHITRVEAAAMHKAGEASWSASYKSINVNIGGAVRGLSCRIGEELAGAYRADRDKNGWAAAMVSNIRLQRESPSNA